jgi:hypothetical protein
MEADPTLQIAANRRRVKEIDQRLQRIAAEIKTGENLKLYYKDKLWVRFVFPVVLFRRDESCLPIELRDICPCNVESTCKDGTQETKRTGEGTLEVRVHFVSDYFHSCRGTVKFMIHKKERPSFRKTAENLESERKSLETEQQDLSSRISKVMTVGEIRDHVEALRQAQDEVFARMDQKRRNRHRLLAKVVRSLWGLGRGDSTGIDTVDSFMRSLADCEELGTGRRGPPADLNRGDLHALRGKVLTWNTVKVDIP